MVKKTNIVELKEDYAIIKIKNKTLGELDCIIDIEDIDKVKNYFWSLRVDKRHTNCTFYVESHPKGKRIHLHRIIMSCPENMIVDHIDGNGLNNRKNNLKICTQNENVKNNHIAKNIFYVKRDDIYMVSFSVNGKTKYLCYTRDLQEATEYAELGRKLLKENKIKELLNMPCKKVDLPKNNKTGCIGVTRLKNGKYQAYFKGKHLGTFAIFENAVKARKQAETDYHLQNKV